MSAYLTMQASLADAAVALKLAQQKMEEGKDLIRYFSVSCKPTKANGGRTKNMPGDTPDKWAVYKKCNAQDVETERDARKKLEQFPVPEREWELYALDQTINDRGVHIDKALVKSAIAVDSEFSAQVYQQAQHITGLDNPGSVAQLKAWLADQDVPMESLAKKLVKKKAEETEGIVSELLNLRLELSKTSIKKHESMARSVCRDGCVRGTMQFYGANRTWRWAGRLLNVQNVPQNHLPDLYPTHKTVKRSNTEIVEMLFGSVPNTLSDLIRTAFIPKAVCRFIMADFSAIEARVLAWLAGEKWVLEEFCGAGKIYEKTASRMYHIPKDTIVKGHPNYEYRQKGKQATLSYGYGGGGGALKAMGAKMPDDKMQPLVDAWRAAKPRIVAFWSAIERVVRSVIRKQTPTRVGKVRLRWKNDKLFMHLPSGRDLYYQSRILLRIVSTMTQSVIMRRASQLRWWNRKPSAASWWRTRRRPLSGICWPAPWRILCITAIALCSMSTMNALWRRCRTSVQWRKPAPSWIRGLPERRNFHFGRMVTNAAAIARCDGFVSKTISRVSTYSR